MCHDYVQAGGLVLTAALPPEIIAFFLCDQPETVLLRE
jgi:hypothetical protein